MFLDVVDRYLYSMNANYEVWWVHGLGHKQYHGSVIVGSSSDTAAMVFGLHSASMVCEFVDKCMDKDVAKRLAYQIGLVMKDNAMKVGLTSSIKIHEVIRPPQRVRMSIH